ncbi:MAG: hypothetical protein GY799_20755, partial [Desulfobulbaceae bacterium]|nr:hypothetical protein [Desulfobulbaceae bacterium]
MYNRPRIQLVQRAVNEAIPRPIGTALPAARLVTTAKNPAIGPLSATLRKEKTKSGCATPRPNRTFKPRIKRTQWTLFVGPFVPGCGDGKDGFNCSASGSESQSLDQCFPNPTLTSNVIQHAAASIVQEPALEVPCHLGLAEQHSCPDFDFWNSNPSSFSVGRRPDSIDA